MKTCRFSADALQLLQEVLERHEAERTLEWIEKLQRGALSRNERARVCEMIGQELMETGLDEHSGPTERGEQLESLLDEINRPNLDKGSSSRR